MNNHMLLCNQITKHLPCTMLSMCSEADTHTHTSVGTLKLSHPGVTSIIESELYSTIVLTKTHANQTVSVLSNTMSGKNGTYRHAAKRAQVPHVYVRELAARDPSSGHGYIMLKSYYTILYYTILYYTIP